MTFVERSGRYVRKSLILNRPTWPESTFFAKNTFLFMLGWWWVTHLGAIQCNCLQLITFSHLILFWRRGFLSRVWEGTLWLSYTLSFFPTLGQCTNETSLVSFVHSELRGFLKLKHLRTTGFIEQGFPNFSGRDPQNNHIWCGESGDPTMFVWLNSTHRPT